MRQAEAGDPEDTCLKFRFRRQLEARSSPGRQSRLCARMSWPNVTAEIFQGRENFWKNRKKEKKRMRQVGSVEIPQEAFMSVLKLDED